MFSCRSHVPSNVQNTLILCMNIAPSSSGVKYEKNMELSSSSVKCEMNMESSSCSVKCEMKIKLSSRVLGRYFLQQCWTEFICVTLASPHCIFCPQTMMISFVYGSRQYICLKWGSFSVKLYFYNDGKMPLLRRYMWTEFFQ